MQQTGTVSRTTGRHIYAYCNLQTQQVIYSLKPSLHNASVRRQLPDTGANTSFVKLRKDLWHPLWSLSIPDGPHADAQGKHAFKKLREWRKLHETSWDPPPTLARPYSDKEIEKLQDELDDRGGKKKESVYDVIKRKKKYLRVNTVMDQRANSIADLAAVLLEQDTLGTKTAQEKEDETAAFLEAERSLMLEMAEKVEQGGLEKIHARIRELEEQKAQVDRLGEAEQSKKELNRKMGRLQAHEKKMLIASKAVAEAKELLAKDVATRTARERIRLQEKTDLSNNLVSKEGLADGSIQAELDDTNVEIARLKHVLASKEAVQQLYEYKESYRQLTFVRDPTSDDATKYMKLLRRREQDSELASEATEVRQKLEADTAESMSNPDTTSKYLAAHEQKKSIASAALESKSKMRQLNQRKAQIEIAFEKLPILLEAEQGGVERLNGAIVQLKRRQRGTTMREATDFAKSNLQSEINALVEKRDHMVAVARHYEAQVAAAAELPALQARVAELADTQTPPKDLEPGSEEYNTALKQFLPSFPKPQDTNPNLPKRGRVRAMQRERKRPTFASKGIKIKWRNPLDAEFAQAWPQDVEHLPMGLVRHTAPHVDQEALLDVASVRMQKRIASQLKADAKRIGGAEREALSGVQNTLARRWEEVNAEREAAIEAQRAAGRARKAERPTEPVREVRPQAPQQVPQSRRAGEESMSSLLDSIR